MINPKYRKQIIEEYVEAHTTSEPEYLQKLREESCQKTLLPRMLSGKTQAAFLSLISRLLQPKRILELGTFTGYSALHLAQGLTQDGKLITIDNNDELCAISSKYFALSPFAKQIHQIIGKAEELIPSLQEKWDLVFIDADKHNYPAYYNLILPQMNKGALLIADNVLWDEKVIDPDEKDKDTLALRYFNNLVMNDPRVENQLLPIRDGLMILKKI